MGDYSLSWVRQSEAAVRASGGAYTAELVSYSSLTVAQGHNTSYTEAHSNLTSNLTSNNNTTGEFRGTLIRATNLKQKQNFKSSLIAATGV